ncbi:MAG: phosphoribosyltransferase family protein [Cyanobacteria bacterium P01_F01_bin.42]
MTTDLFIPWSRYHQLIEALAASIYRSEWHFNQIICLARGGLRIGDVLSRIYNQPLAILSVSSYCGEAYQTRGQVNLSKTLTMAEPSLGDRILLVDDLVDSGATFIETLAWLQSEHNIQPDSCRTAVLWYKECSQITPDYFVQRLPHSPWIHQPFEAYENQPLTNLMEQFHSTGSMISGQNHSAD